MTDRSPPPIPRSRSWSPSPATRADARRADVGVAHDPAPIPEQEDQHRRADPGRHDDGDRDLRSGDRPLRPLRGVDRQGGRQRFEKPCVHLLGCDPEKPQHILGIDGNVRDQFSRIVYGSRVSLTLGISTVTIAILVGATIGAVAGYKSGWIDNLLMRIMDVVLGFPGFLLAIAIVAALGPGLRNTLIALAIVTIPQYARVMRASVLSIKEIDYVAASEALGASSWRILLTRIAPNAITPLIVLGTLGIASAILEAAGLGFLGLGAQPPQAEWGSMLAANRNRVFSDPHLVFFPGWRS
jgi:peptide/nickel transport system permease protein